MRPSPADYHIITIETTVTIYNSQGFHCMGVSLNVRENNNPNEELLLTLRFDRDITAEKVLDKIRLNGLQLELYEQSSLKIQLSR